MCFLTTRSMWTSCCGRRKEIWTRSFDIYLVLVNQMINCQWIGNYSGQTNGVAVVDLDEIDGHYVGYAYLVNANRALPTVAVTFTTIGTPNFFKLNLTPQVVHPRTGELLSITDAQSLYSGVTFAKSVTADINLVGNTLQVNWLADHGVTSTANLTKSLAGAPSDLQSRTMSWDQFKLRINVLAPRQFVFRGQAHPHRLRTYFHRTGRANLRRFLSDDIPALHRHLTARTKHVFNLLVPDENGAFFNLVQHHGYPTPLLDWTYSPYVAAYFAFRGIKSSDAAKAKPTDYARIFLFDKQRWAKDFPQLYQLTPNCLHFSLQEFLAIENERIVPQQGISGLTNVDDIESYVRANEVTQNTTYLTAIDVPHSERDIVMRELRMMGITAGSLFPGLDGACEELRERHFKI